jgi:hypothetical protein
MMRPKSPIVLHLPRAPVLCIEALVAVVARRRALGRAVRARLCARFAFKCDEQGFVTRLLRRRANFWAFRSGQDAFCGDFVLVDMSSPSLTRRPVYVLELKRRAALSLGGLGVQLRNAPRAVAQIARDTGIIAPDSAFETLTGSAEAVLGHFGVVTL